jgi:hypothetical protein
LVVPAERWSEVSNDFQSLAALVHIDVLSSLSPARFRTLPIPRSVFDGLTRFYGDVTLETLFADAVSLLSLFCPNSLHNFETSEFCFGAIRECFQRFHNSCFPSIPIGQRCLTPGTLRQLRAFGAFVSASLARLGFETMDDLNETVHTFQKVNGLTEDRCDLATLRLIWTKLIELGADPVELFRDVGIAIAVPPITETGRFGEIDGSACDDAGMRIAVGLSRSIANLSSPSAAVAAAQRHLLATGQASAQDFATLTNETEGVRAELGVLIGIATDVGAEAEKAELDAEGALRVVEELTAMNKQVGEKLVIIKQRMKQESGRTTLFVLLLLVLVAALLLQWWSQRRVVAVES